MENQIGKPGQTLKIKKAIDTNGILITLFFYGNKYTTKVENGFATFSIDINYYIVPNKYPAYIQYNDIREDFDVIIKPLNTYIQLIDLNNEKITSTFDEKPVETPYLPDKFDSITFSIYVNNKQYSLQVLAPTIIQDENGLYYKSNFVVDLKNLDAGVKLTFPVCIIDENNNYINNADALNVYDETNTNITDCIEVKKVGNAYVHYISIWLDKTINKTNKFLIIKYDTNNLIEHNITRLDTLFALGSDNVEGNVNSSYASASTQVNIKNINYDDNSKQVDVPVVQSSLVDGDGNNINYYGNYNSGKVNFDNQLANIGLKVENLKDGQQDFMIKNEDNFGGSSNSSSSSNSLSDLNTNANDTNNKKATSGVYNEELVVKTEDDGQYHTYFDKMTLSNDSRSCLATLQLECMYSKKIMSYWLSSNQDVDISISQTPSGGAKQETKFYGKVASIKRKGYKLELQIESIGRRFKQKIPEEFRSAYIFNQNVRDCFQAICEFIGVHFVCPPKTDDDEASTNGTTNTSQTTNALNSATQNLNTQSNIAQTVMGTNQARSNTQTNNSNNRNVNSSTTSGNSGNATGTNANTTGATDAAGTGTAGTTGTTAASGDDLEMPKIGYSGVKFDSNGQITINGTTVEENPNTFKNIEDIEDMPMSTYDELDIKNNKEATKNYKEKIKSMKAALNGSSTTSNTSTPTTTSNVASTDSSTNGTAGTTSTNTATSSTKTLKEQLKEIHDLEQKHNKSEKIDTLGDIEKLFKGKKFPELHDETMDYDYITIEVAATTSTTPTTTTATTTTGGVNNTTTGTTNGQTNTNTSTGSVNGVSSTMSTGNNSASTGNSSSGVVGTSGNAAATTGTTGTTGTATTGTVAGQSAGGAVAVNSDNINGNSQDSTRIQNVCQALQQAGYQATASGVGPNTHSTDAQSYDNTYIVCIVGGACAGTFQDMASNYYQNYLKQHSNKVGIAFLTTYSKSYSSGLMNVSHLEKAWDDNFSGGDFNGIDNPVQFLQSAGIGYCEAYTEEELPQKVVSMVSGQAAAGGTTTQASSQIKDKTFEDCIRRICAATDSVFIVQGNAAFMFPYTDWMSLTARDNLPTIDKNDMDINEFETKTNNQGFYNKIVVKYDGGKKTVQNDEYVGLFGEIKKEIEQEDIDDDTAEFKANTMLAQCVRAYQNEMKIKMMQKNKMIPGSFVHFKNPLTNKSAVCYIRGITTRTDKKYGAYLNVTLTYGPDSAEPVETQGTGSAQSQATGSAVAEGTTGLAGWGDDTCALNAATIQAASPYSSAEEICCAIRTSVHYSRYPNYANCPEKCLSGTLCNCCDQARTVVHMCRSKGIMATLKHVSAGSQGHLIVSVSDGQLCDPSCGIARFHTYTSCPAGGGCS